MAMLKKGINDYEFLSKVIYPAQFRGKTKDKRLVFHILNSCYSLFGGSDISRREKLFNVCHNYLDHQSAEIYLDDMLLGFSPSDCQCIRPDCFTFIKDILSEDDCYYIQNRRRIVTLKEFKFMLSTVVNNILKSKNYISTLTNSYFLTTFKKSYFKETGKKISINKISHIMLVLQKHKLLHIMMDSRNRRTIQLGSANPYYMLADVPEVIEQDIKTAKDRYIEQLENENRMMRVNHNMTDEQVLEKALWLRMK